jgi:hypothetical protein
VIIALICDRKPALEAMPVAAHVAATTPSRLAVAAAMPASDDAYTEAAAPDRATNAATDADALSIDEPIAFASFRVSGIASAKLLPTPVALPINIVSGDRANTAALPSPPIANDATWSDSPRLVIAPPMPMAATASLANPATASLFLLMKSVSPSMNPVMNGTTAARAGATASETAIAIRCNAARTLPAEPARPLMSILYFSPTGRADAIASRMPLNPSTPVVARIDAARIASAPKMRRKRSSFAVWSSPPIACVSVPMMSTIGFMFPSAPRNEATDRPSSSRAPTASSAGAMSRISIVLTLVPASLPFTPLLARIASVADRSSMLCPARPATADDIENASDI